MNKFWEKSKDSVGIPPRQQNVNQMIPGANPGANSVHFFHSPMVFALERFNCNHPIIENRNNSNNAYDILLNELRDTLSVHAPLKLLSKKEQKKLK